jgi:hypothetical protein
MILSYFAPKMKALLRAIFVIGRQDSAMPESLVWRGRMDLPFTAHSLRRAKFGKRGLLKAFFHAGKRTAAHGLA